MIANKLEPHELQFAQEIADQFGGTFTGAAKRSLPGIDGSFNGGAASLKETQGGLSTVLKAFCRSTARIVAPENLGGAT